MCPTCMDTLSNATSLLASKVIQRARHEYEHDGCEEKIPLNQLEKHVFKKMIGSKEKCKNIELTMILRGKEGIKITTTCRPRPTSQTGLWVHEKALASILNYHPGDELSFEIEYELKNVDQD